MMKLLKMRRSLKGFFLRPWLVGSESGQESTPRVVSAGVELRSWRPCARSVAPWNWSASLAGRKIPTSSSSVSPATPVFVFLVAVEESLKATACARCLGWRYQKALVAVPEPGRETSWESCQGAPWRREEGSCRWRSLTSSPSWERGPSVPLSCCGRGVGRPEEPRWWRGAARVGSVNIKAYSNRGKGWGSMHTVTAIDITVPSTDTYHKKGREGPS